MWLIVGGVVVVAFLLLMYARARSVVKRHSVTLSHVTGMPADTIAREMRDGNLTPGEWAAQHGLDPMTFTPNRDLLNDVTATVARDYPSETILAATRGTVRPGGGLMAIAATDQSVHVQWSEDAQRVEYCDILRVEHGGAEASWELGNFRLDDCGGGGFSAHLLDGGPVATAIDGQLERITLHTERVELTPDGGATFRWRPLGRRSRIDDREDTYEWFINYDPGLLGPDGRSTDEARAAAAEAIERLNRLI